jgi:hypothetical protein
MVGIGVVEELGRRYAERAADLLDGSQRSVLRSVLQTRKRSQRDA